MPLKSSLTHPHPPRLGRFASLKFGALLPFQAGWLILRTPRLLFWSFLPLGITLALYVWGVQKASHAAETWLLHQLGDTLRGELGGFLGRIHEQAADWVFLVLKFSLQLTLFIIGALTFSIASSLIASPFNDLLAEASEPHCEPALPPVKIAGVSGRLRLVLLDTIKTLAATLALLLAVLFSWIPGLNLAAAGVACLLASFQYLSYPQTRRSEGLLKSLSFLVRCPWASFGFGGVVTLGFALPLVSVVVLPMAVVGGTLLYAGGSHRRLR
jgi:uncharacterized protein involved in cysteine biosynthesis